MTKIIFAFTLALFSFGANAQFHSERDPFLIKEFPGQTIEKLDVQTSHGNISVSSVDASKERVEVFVHSNQVGEQNLSKEELQKRLDDFYTLTISVSNGKLTAIAKQKENILNWKKSISISFTVYVPQAVSSQLGTSHGNILLTNLTGDQDVSTSHGNLELDKIVGRLKGGTSHGNITVSNSSTDIDLSTSHGNIDTKNCEGTVKLSTSNGNIEINGVKGKVHAGTSHGDISGDNVSGELVATTSHGNVDFRNLSCSVETSTDHGHVNLYFNELTGSVSVDNSHGGITLQLPKGKGATLDLQGKTIKIENMENFNGSKEEHSVKGTLNGGGPTIKARTSKETISVTFK